MFVSAIIVAAGKGKRFKSRISKPLIKLNGIPLIAYSIRAMAAQSLVKEIIVAVNSDNRIEIERQLKRWSGKKNSKTILGGKERQDSVLNGVLAADQKSDYVLIHDAARPLVSQDVIRRTILEAG